jgi:hypothetical protein
METTAGDQRLVEKAAREFIEWHGAQAVLVLRDCAESAAAAGDTRSASTWQEIADAAKRLLSGV